MRTVEFLDAVKARHKLATDYKLAKFLGWNPSRIAHYRTTPRELDDDACVQIAEALELPAPYVMACVAAARAKRADIKKHWLAAARLLKTGTAAVVLATVLATAQFAPGRAQAETVRLTEPSIHYAPRWRRRSGTIWRRRRRRKSRTATPIVA